MTRTDDYTAPGGIKLFFEENFVGNTGYRDLGNLVTSELESAVEKLEHFTNRSGQRTKDKEAVSQVSISIKFTFDEANKENLRYFFLAGALTSVVAGSVQIPREVLRLTGTDAITTALPIAVVPGVVVQTIATTPVTLLPDTVTGGDYHVDQANSTLTRIAITGGDITDGQDVMVTYNAQLPAHTSMPMLTSPIREGKARLLLQPTAGAQMVWDITKCSIAPDGTLSLDDQDWLKAPMVLTILADTASNPTAPFGTLRTWTET